MDVPAETLPVLGATAFVAVMPVPASPSGGRTECRRQKPFKERSPGLRQLTCGLSGHQDLGQNAAGRPREAVFGNQCVKLFEHRRVIVQRFTVNGEHTGGFTHAEDVFAREQIVDIAGKRRDVRDIFDVRFAVQNGLIQMRNGPALWDVEAEFLP